MGFLYHYTEHFVYELIDPRDNSVFYIGVSVCPGERFKNHLYDPASACWPRVRNMVRSGVTPEVAIVASFPTRQEAFDCEYELIIRTKGLVNIPYHGPGNRNWAPERRIG